MSTETYLVTIEQVKEITVVTENVDAKYIRPHLMTAQSLKMMPLLGKQLLDLLISELSTEVTIAAATQANPVVVTTTAAHGFTTGDSVYIATATGMVGINGQWDVTVLNATTFELDGLDGTAFPAYNVGTGTAMAMSAVNVALMPYVRNAMAWHVLSEAVPFLWAHITNAGIQTHGGTRGLGNSEGGNPVGANDMKWFKQQCANTANAQEQILYDWMDLNSTDYPLWQPLCTYTGTGTCQGTASNGSTGINGPAHRKGGLNIRFP